MKTAKSLQTKNDLPSTESAPVFLKIVRDCLDISQIQCKICSQLEEISFRFEGKREQEVIKLVKLGSPH